MVAAEVAAIFYIDSIGYILYTKVRKVNNARYIKILWNYNKNVFATKRAQSVGDTEFRSVTTY